MKSTDETVLACGVSYATLHATYQKLLAAYAEDQRSPAYTNALKRAMAYLKKYKAPRKVDGFWRVASQSDLQARKTQIRAYDVSLTACACEPWKPVPTCVHRQIVKLYNETLSNNSA
jgi:hypothetical protein